MRTGDLLAPPDRSTATMPVRVRAACSIRSPLKVGLVELLPGAVEDDA